MLSIEETSAPGPRPVEDTAAERSGRLSVLMPLLSLPAGLMSLVLLMPVVTALVNWQSVLAALMTVLAFMCALLGVMLGVRSRRGGQQRLGTRGIVANAVFLFAVQMPLGVWFSSAEDPYASGPTVVNRTTQTLVVYQWVSVVEGTPRMVLWRSLDPGESAHADAAFLSLDGCYPHASRLVAQDRAGNVVATLQPICNHTWDITGP